MSLKYKFFITCDICGEEKELDRVYGDYWVYMACTPNNPHNKIHTNDGFMGKEYKLCNKCGKDVREYIDLQKAKCENKVDEFIVVTH